MKPRKAGPTGENRDNGKGNLCSPFAPVKSDPAALLLRPLRPSGRTSFPRQVSSIFILMFLVTGKIEGFSPWHRSVL